jgi:hypothetical protein
MIDRTSARLARLAVVLGVAITAIGCNTGGLLVAEKTSVDPNQPKVEGPSVNDLVASGTYAKNAKYKVFFTVGQSTPNQGVSTSPDQRVNGGLVGAANSN